MFWIGLVIGLLVGANISLILYACVITAREADRVIGYIDEDDEDYIDAEFEECDEDDI